MIKVGEYTLYKIIGKGSFGEVYLTKKDNSSKIYATKKLDKNQTDRPSIKKYFDNEISIMKKLNHPNIVKFYDMLTSHSHYYVIIEYCNGGSLTSCLKKYKKLYHKPFTQEIVQYLMRQIIDGLMFIHSRKIIHRDIKLDNILVTFPNESAKEELNMLASQVKIIDFGLATELGPEDLTFTALGSPINMDPIILKKYNRAGGYEQLQGYNEKADIWSLGTVCYEMLIGEALYKVKDMKDLMKKVEKGNYTIPLNLNLSKEAVSFLLSMIQYEADDRLSANELAKHNFIVKDIKDFSPLDLNALSHKIDNNNININFKQDETILDIINNENNKKEVKPNQQNQLYNQNWPNNDNYQNQQNYQEFQFNQKKQKSKHISPDNMRRNIIEQKYVFSNDIYHYNNNVNDFNHQYYYNQNLPSGNNFFPHKGSADNMMDQFNFIRMNMNKPFENIHKITEGYISPSKNNIKRKEYGKKEKEILDKKGNDKVLYDKKSNGLNEKEKQETKKYLNGLLEEYNAAKEYFKENELKNQEEDAKQKIIQIQYAKIQFEKSNSISFNSLPKPIIPEYIYGRSTSERDNKFKDIISKYTEEKNKLESDLKNEILNLKKLEPEKYAKEKAAVMPKLETEKAKLDKLKKIIEGFENKMKNKWVPAPKISKELDTCQKEVISNENKDYKLKIGLGKTNYKKDNLVLNIYLTVNENKTFKKEVRLKTIGDFDEEIIWTLTQNEWNNIDNFLFVLDYYTGNMEENGAIKLNINQIKDGKDLLFECPIDLNSQDIPIKLNINLHPIFPVEKNNFSSDKKDSISIKKIYPAFKGKSKDTNEIPNCLYNS